MSPQAGSLDEAAFGDLSEQDPDEALSLLADLTGATDPALRALARRLAGRVLVDLAAPAGTTRRGPLGKLRSQRLPEEGGDVDLDASLDALVAARAGRRPASVEDLVGRVWSRPSLGLCLLVDRSGSMGGERLASAALAAACVAWRAPEDHSVIAFSDQPLLVQRQGGGRSAEAIADDLFALRGHGPTDLAAALRFATQQLSRSPAERRVAILFSDGRPTEGDDPTDAAIALAAFAELAVVAPATDDADAIDLAAKVGGRCVSLAGPASVPETMATLFAR